MAPRPTTRELALLGAFAFFFFFTSSTRAPNAALDRGFSYLTSTANRKGINWPWADDSTNLPQLGFLDATRRMWGDGLPPETLILAHTPGSTPINRVYEMLISQYHTLGFTMFDNLYSFNNTLFVVTSDPSSVPKPSLILSAGLPLSVDKYVCFPPACRPSSNSSSTSATGRKKRPTYRLIGTYK